MEVLKVTKKSGAVVSLPAPDELKWNISDLDADGTGRNQNGDMFRDRVAVKRKLECSWRPLVSAEMAKLLQAVDDVFFSLTYPDAMTGTDRTMMCYVSPPVCSSRRSISPNRQEPLKPRWTALTR